MLERIFTQIRFRFFDFKSKQQDTTQPGTTHLNRSLRWFKASLLPDGGASAKYSMMTHEVAPGYPMTTAMWIPALLKIKNKYPEIYHDVMGTTDITGDLVNWVLLTQRRDGTFPGSFGDFMNQPPRVFNNGVIIRNLLRYYETNQREDVLNACIQSAEWLLKVQSNDGSWRQFTFHQLSSNTITGAALIRLGQICNEPKYVEAGEKNIRFAIGLQSENGYFRGNGFDSASSAYTITIGYALNGILQAAELTGNDDYIKSALNGLVPVLNLVRKDGFLVGEIDEQFRSQSSFTCLPGNALLAMASYHLSKMTGNSDLKLRGDLLTDYLKSRQMDSQTPTISGGISGSWPISGNYCSYEIPSWAVRYFTEALLLQDELK